MLGWNGGTNNSARQKEARRLYDKYKDAEKPTGGGSEGSSSGDSRVIKTFTSDITGKTFRVFNQGRIPGWGDRCNRAAAMCIASGYSNGASNQTLIDMANAQPNNSMPNHQPYWNNYGLRSWAGRAHTNYTSELRNELQNGHYAAIYIKGKSYRGKTAPNAWTSAGAGAHWVAIIGYRNNGGQEQIYVADSGHNNTGWYPIDEFLSYGGSEIAYITYVSER